MVSNHPYTAKDYLSPETLSHLAGMELRARMVVEGLMTGMHRSPHRGTSIEFAQHRPYTPGDDLRHLDWKVFGRTDKLYIKEHHQETTLDLMILVDASGSMEYGSQLANGNHWRKYDHATAIAAAIAYLALVQQDRVGLIIYADEFLETVRPSSNRGQWRSIVEALCTQPVDRPTHMGRVFDQLVAQNHQHTLMVIISDLFDDIDVLEAGMAKIHHARHDAILCHTLDQDELNFTMRNPVRFLGLEDDGELDIDPGSIRNAYLESLNTHIQAIEAQARRFRFDHALLDTSKPVGPVLSHFLAHRASILSKD